MKNAVWPKFRLVISMRYIEVDVMVIHIRKRRGSQHVSSSTAFLSSSGTSGGHDSERNIPSIPV